MKRLYNSLLLAGVFSTLVVPLSLKAEFDLDINLGEIADELLDLSLEELIALDVPDVTSVSKRKQRLMDSPAAVYVITDKDIKRTGVTSIPEALRMVPGMQVAKLNSNTWSISTRGFNYIFANKLLVLVDGRTVYSPLFSGVNWDVQDTMLEDIARIEVIRGPGAALWGANAVNGVINIITKHSADTQGGLLSIGAGSEEKAFASYRYGGEISDDGYYRAFFKSFSRDAMANSDGSDANDDWKMSRAGFRADWRTDTGAEASVQTEVYNGTTRPSLKIFNRATLKKELLQNQSRDQKGGHLIGNYKHYFDNDSNIALKAYYDRYENYDYRVTEKRDIGDVEFQHQLSPIGQHDIIWGLGYRLTKYNLSKMNNIVLPETSRTDELYSAFVQDYITLNPQWSLTLSSRFEHNNFTGYEFQPNASLTWKISDQQTLWIKAANALKTPSISETSVTSRGITFLREEEAPVPGTALPDQLSLSGNNKLDAENLFALEVGYRRNFNSNLLFDATAFFNQYKDLLAYVDQQGCQDGTSLKEIVTGAFLCVYDGSAATSPSVAYSTTFSNGLTAHTYGIELTADWQATPWWKLQLNYSFLGIDAFSDDTSSDVTNAYLESNEKLLENLSANNTANIRSYMNLPKQWYLDFWVRYMDTLKDARIGAYTTLDVRVAKKIGDDLELSLNGKNLIDKQRLEFNEIFSGLGETEIQRSWYLQLRWQH